MNFKEFITKWNNKLCDYDGYYSGQCMDLYRQYCKDVLNTPQSPPVSGAAEVWDNYLDKYFVKIPNTITGIPKEGDIIIWNKQLNGYGHIAICQTANIWNFTSFDQNFPTSSKCHFQKHNYKYVLGWLRPISQILPSGIVTIARIGTNLPSGEDFKAEVAKFTNNKLTLIFKDYNAPLKDDGMLTQDEAYDFLRMIKVFGGDVKENFIQFYYQSPDAPFLVSYSFPEQHKYISTLPNNPPGRLISFELAHSLQYFCNDNFAAHIQVEDSNFPDELLIQRKYDTVVKYLDKIK